MPLCQTDSLGEIMDGGELSGVMVPPSPPEVRPQLQELTNIWSKTDKDAAQGAGPAQAGAAPRRPQASNCRSTKGRMPPFLK